MAGAQALRRAASADSYAGMRGRDVADALAAGLEGLAMDWGTVRRQARHDFLHAVRILRDGPDGPHDPRGGTVPPLSAGPGH